MKALCFGSLNIDYTYSVDHMVQKGETLSSYGLNVFTGGKGLNQSVALAKAGVNAFHAGSIGEDGGFLLDLMQKAGVDVRFVDILKDVRTGNAIIQNDKDGDNCILLYGGANQAITIEQVDRVLDFFEKGDYLILQNEINQLSYIMEKAHEKGLIIVLNPSPMNEKILALPLDYVNYFMLNEVEAGQILGTDDINGDTLGKALLERFPSAGIVLTLGSRGSVYYDANTRVEQKAYRVKAVDTTAAGDTFTGFFIGGLLMGKEVGAAMDLASRASAIAVGKKGAAPSIPSLEEVLAWEA